jgi:hypothetical protein
VKLADDKNIRQGIRKKEIKGNLGLNTSKNKLITEKYFTYTFEK